MKFWHTTLASMLAIMILFGSPSAYSQIETGISEENASSTEEEAARALLETQIRSRAEELERVTRELAETQKNLSETQHERRTLQEELNRIQYNTNQLQLNIKSDEISIKKLDLEIQSLTFDIQDIQASIFEKKAAIGDVFREIQFQSDINPLMILLRNKSLADSIAEIQSLNDLNNKLLVDVTNLVELNGRLSSKVEESDQKRLSTISHQTNLTNRKYILEDEKKEQSELLITTKSKETLFQEQLKELQRLQREIADEIETINAQLRTEIDISLLPTARPGVLGYPVDAVPMITQRYGSTQFAQSAYPGRVHNGVDLRAPLGTPILAAESGGVVAVGDQDAIRGCYRGAYGKFIVINHENNLTTLYGHLSRYIVAAGDRVERGDIIGYSGSTGYATGPHLHFTVFAQPTFYMGRSRVCGAMPYGGDLNPIGYLVTEPVAPKPEKTTSTAPSSTPQ